MSPALQPLLTALGNGSYTQACELAEALLASCDDAGLRTEAVTCLVTSRLAQGDFAGAHAAADLLPEQEGVMRAEMLVRIARTEFHHQAEISRLQPLLATASGADAQTQLQLAALHQAAGRTDLAAELYQKLVEERPDHPIAGQALSRLIELRLQAWGADAAIEIAQAALDGHPDARPVVRAAIRALSAAHLAADGSTAALTALQDLSTSHATPLIAHEVSGAVLEVTFAHLGGASGTVDQARLPDAVAYATWAAAQLPEGPAAARAHFHLAYYARWQKRSDDACVHAAKALTLADLDPVTAAEARAALSLDAPSDPFSADSLAWIASACEHTRDQDWFGLQPTDPAGWRQVAQAAATLSATEATETPWASLAAAHCYLRAEMPESALPLLERVVTRWPQRPEAQTASLELAPLLTHADRADEAVALCEHLLGRNLPPDLEAAARRELARARLCRGDGLPALQEYFALMAKEQASPTSEQALRDVATVAADCLGQQSAVEILSRLRDQYSTTPVGAMARYQIARLQRGDRFTLAAAELCLDLLAQFPHTEAAALAVADLRENASVLAEGAIALNHQGRHQEMVSWFGTLAPYCADLEEPELHALLNALTASAGLTRELAQAALPALKRLQPSCQQYPEKLALLYRAQGDVAAAAGDQQTALTAWEALLTAYPDSAPAAFAALTAAPAYLAARQPDRALKAYLTASRAVRYLSPDDRLAAKLGAGRSLEALGRYEEAAFEYRSILALAADEAPAIAQEAAAALARLSTP